ncbi:MAG TPA: ABC transporter permease [Tepidisphaeraceae bacterium]|nr:ABC transporter permease [Tepidisphaeraceae bacterium]
MTFVALRMLFGDRAKYLAIVIGLTFASLLITQQAGLFVGIMEASYSSVAAVSLPDVWVMDPEVRFIDDRRPMSDTALQRVRGVTGVEWAVPMFKGIMRARLPNGKTEDCQVIGLDDATLIGGPPRMLEGNLVDLRKSEGVIIDEVTARDKLGRQHPDDPALGAQPLRVGDSFELNDRRATVVGICERIRQSQGLAVVYTTYGRAVKYAPYERRMLTYVLAKAQPGINLERLCEIIRRDTGLAAYTAEGFKRLTLRFVLQQTPLAIVFGFVVLMGFVIGVAIAGQTFYAFTVANLPYFGMLKAMGTGTPTLLRMIVTQAFIAGGVGYGIGVGLSTAFGYVMGGGTLAFRMPWYLFAGSGVAILLICTTTSIFSMVRVLRLEPAMIFKA